MHVQHGCPSLPESGDDGWEICFLAINPYLFPKLDERASIHL